jgi:hypothetical protein
MPGIRERQHNAAARVEQYHNPSKYCGLRDQVGAIAPGMDTDIIATDGEPAPGHR